MAKVIVTGSFDDLRSSDIRFLEEAARRGELHVYLWSDELVRKLDGHPPKFPQPERLYLLQAIRYINQVHLVNQLADRDSLPKQVDNHLSKWVVNEKDDNDQKRAFCASKGFNYQVIKPEIIKINPKDQNNSLADISHNKKVVVTGCYDWLHSGHIRFFEEVSELGDLYVVAGSDQNVQLLKGKGHPMFPQEERCYVVQAIRFVKQALISSGSGWMDAEPEIVWIKPDFYAVNEDGDKPDKRSFCDAHGIEYVVLKRMPKEGLPKRQSVDLRGF